MDAVREKWTDQRLDDLNAKVDDLGRRMDLRFERIDQRIDRLTWVMTTTMITGFMGLAGLIVTQG
jgi:hypothetical protein